MFTCLCLQLAALIAILKPARQMGLVDQICYISIAGEEAITIPEEIFRRAICHSSEELQTDAMHLVCTYPKVTLMPSMLLPPTYCEIPDRKIAAKPM